MANEISLNATIQYAKGNFADQRTIQCQADVSGTVATGGVQKIGTTHEAVNMGDVGTAGWAWFLNTDATNFITLGIVVSGTFYPVMKLKPKIGFPLCLGTNALYAKADTAEATLQYTIYEA